MKSLEGSELSQEDAKEQSELHKLIVEAEEYGEFGRGVLVGAATSAYFVKYEVDPELKVLGILLDRRGQGQDFDGRTTITINRLRGKIGDTIFAEARKTLQKSK